jgi:undecaprenyl diphosphate synthase
VSLKNNINLEKLPKHIAIIMDGNGRWAKTKGKFRIFGHKSGVNAVKEVSEAAAELGVQCVTLYAFSTENWSRPQKEVDALMELLVKTIRGELPTLQKNNIRLRAIGNLESLPTACRESLQDAINQTKNNTRLELILALSYSSKWDMVNAVKKIAEKVTLGELKASEINESTINNALSTYEWPHPELLIRTSGEHRVSNFLLWEIAYCEFYFTDTLWPDYTKEDLYEAILSFQKRERRFGKISEQILEKTEE